MPTDGPFTHILACTDLSPNALGALRWAASTAAQHGARLTLFHCAPEAVSPLALQDKVDRNLAETARALAARTRIDVVRCAGRPWESILLAARERGADLIVLGSRGHTACDRLRLGSTADRVVRSAGVPVLVVHPGDAFPPEGPSTVLLGIDFSADAHQALRTTVRLLDPLAGAQLVHLLHVRESPLEYRIDSAIATAARQLSTGRERLERELEAMAGPLSRAGRRVETELSEGRASLLLEERAQRHRVDLIVIGASGQSGGAGPFFLGRVAERVLHNAPCPVITARAAAGGPADGRPGRA